MRKLFYILIGFILLLSACVKEKFDSSKVAGLANISPGLLVPIGHATMSLSKYLNDTSHGKMLGHETDNTIILVYHEKVFSIEAANLISIPDTGLQYILLYPTSMVKGKSSPSPIIIEDSTYIGLTVQGANALLESVNFTSGIINLDVKNTKNLKGKCTITFPGIEGNINSIAIDSLVEGDNPGSLNLSKSTMQLMQANGKSNLLKANIHFVLTSQNNFTGSESLLDFNFKISNIHYSVIYGLLGNISFPLAPGTFSMGFYKRLLEGNFYFTNPELELLLTNSIGFPVEIYFKDIYATTRNQGIIPLTGPGVPGIGNPRIVNFPHRPFEIEKDSIEFQGKNSNLPLILSALPVSMFFNVVDSLNPVSNMTRGFITDSSKLEADLQMELPLQGYTDSILLEQDTVNFQFPSDIYKNQNEIKFVYFILNVKNGFPMEVIPQVYFTDNKNHVIDSLITDPTATDKALIHSSGINADGSASAVTTDQIIVKFTPERIQKILNATRLITRGKLISGGGKHKEIRFNYGSANKDLNSLYFELGIIVQLQINTGL